MDSSIFFWGGGVCLLTVYIACVCVCICLCTSAYVRLSMSVHVFVQYVSRCIHTVYNIDCSQSDVLLLDARSALNDFASNLTARCSVFLTPTCQ